MAMTLPVLKLASTTLGKPSYFDGQEIGGQDWSCTLDGQCSGEGEDWTDKFTVSIAETAVMISYPDGRTYKLPDAVGDRRPASPRRPNEDQKPLDCVLLLICFFVRRSATCSDPVLTISPCHEVGGI